MWVRIIIAINIVQYTYDELSQQSEDILKNIHNWRCNPTAALPSWFAIVEGK